VVPKSKIGRVPVELEGGGSGGVGGEKDEGRELS